MSLLKKMTVCATFIILLGSNAHFHPLQADEGHAQHEMKMDGQEKMMEHHEEKEEMHHHAPTKKDRGPDLPPGTKEVVVDLSGPFCDRHPKEIISALMALDGVLHVEAFNRRDYILVHFNGDLVNPDTIATTIDGLKGSGWRCDGTVSTRKRTER